MLSRQSYSLNFKAEEGSQRWLDCLRSTTVCERPVGCLLCCHRSDNTSTTAGAQACQCINTPGCRNGQEWRCHTFAFQVNGITSNSGSQGRRSVGSAPLGRHIYFVISDFSLQHFHDRSRGTSWNFTDIADFEVAEYSVERVLPSWLYIQGSWR
jgi:hypothetical protein